MELLVTVAAGARKGVVVDEALVDDHVGEQVGSGERGVQASEWATERVLLLLEADRVLQLVPNLLRAALMLQPRF